MGSVAICFRCAFPYFDLLIRSGRLRWPAGEIITRATVRQPYSLASSGSGCLTVAAPLPVVDFHFLHF